MSDSNQFGIQDISDTIDHEFGNRGFDPQDFQHEVPSMDINSFSGQDIFQHHDPLKFAPQFQFQPLQIDLPPNHHVVEPHHVKGYTRADGTYVEGYYRDGDGNTDINRTVEQGGGYLRGNPGEG